jgi:hypothetical protein
MKTGWKSEDITEREVLTVGEKKIATHSSSLTWNQFSGGDGDVY